MSESCVKTGWEVHAFCLMPNHFHLVVEAPQPNLVVGMKWLLGTYGAVQSAALAKRGWSEADLKSRKKGDPAKVEIAGRLRRETTMTLRWIAIRLTMGSLAYLNNRLYLARKQEK